MMPSLRLMLLFHFADDVVTMMAITDIGRDADARFADISSAAILFIIFIITRYFRHSLASFIIIFAPYRQHEDARAKAAACRMQVPSCLPPACLRDGAMMAYVRDRTRCYYHKSG